MKRFFGKVAACALALVGMSAGAMTLGIRTMLHARAAQLQAVEPVWTVTFDAQGGTVAELTIHCWAGMRRRMAASWRRRKRSSSPT